MSHRVLPRLSLVLVPSLIAGIAAMAVLVPVVEARQPGATATAEAESATLTVPPLPKGTPEQLLAFVEGLLPPKTQPTSREEMIAYISDVSRVSVQAADAILPQVKVDDPLYEKAAKLKLASLMRTLWPMGLTLLNSYMLSWMDSASNSTSSGLRIS